MLELFLHLVVTLGCLCPGTTAPPLFSLPDGGGGVGAFCHAVRMKRLLRRLLGRPTISERYESVGRAMADSLVAGLRDPRPLTAEEWAELDAYTGAVARRSFWALYDDED